MLLISHVEPYAAVLGKLCLRTVSLMLISMATCATRRASGQSSAASTFAKLRFVEIQSIEDPAPVQFGLLIINREQVPKTAHNVSSSAMAQLSHPGALKGILTPEKVRQFHNLPFAVAERFGASTLGSLWETLRGYIRCQSIGVNHEINLALRTVPLYNSLHLP
jgi:hypothetical protein